MSEYEIARRLVDGVWTTDARLEPGGDSSAVISVDTTNLSSAQLLDLDQTAVELLPAPGGRLYYVVFGLVLHYRFVSQAYAENEQNALVVGFGTTPAVIADTAQGLAFLPLAISAGVGDLFKKTADFYVSVPASTVNQALGGYILAASSIEDQPLSIAIDPSFMTPLTGGDSTLTVRTYYGTIDGAP